MGERKVLNKYFGPDFDPEKIPRKKRQKNDQFVVRMMLPMSVRCKACGEYMYQGKKFNSRRENVEGENYLGIGIIRFYMNCTNCRAEFCIKTDPKNETYIAETGVHRNYEPWRDREAEIEAAHAQRAEEDDTDAMKRLENRTKDSKLEMDALDALDELRTMNARNNAASIDELIARKREVEAPPDEQAAEPVASLDEDDEATVQSLFGGHGKRFRRVEDSDDDDAANRPLASAAPTQPVPTLTTAQPVPGALAAARPAQSVLIKPVIRVQPKPVAARQAGPSDLQPPTAAPTAAKTVPLLEGLADYGSSESG